MFEDFSFSSPSSNGSVCLALDADDKVMIDCDSSLISPLSSRCPSPPLMPRSSKPLPHHLSRTRSSQFRSAQPPTSMPASEYNKHRLSIGTLTKKLHAHTLQCGSDDEHNDEMGIAPRSIPRSVRETTPTTSARHAGYVLTPPDTDHDDEGYYESSSMTSASPSDPQSPFLSAMSVPQNYFPLDAALDSPFEPVVDKNNHHDEQRSVRLQRQRISRIQCNATSGIEAIRLALLAEDEPADFDNFGEDDYHPSSLPMSPPGRRRSVLLNRSRFRQNSIVSGSGLGGDLYAATDPRGRRKSSAGIIHHASSHRIDKSHHYHQASSSREMLRKKSEQGLRRRSIVCAALAAMEVNSSDCSSYA
ncbi:hypothetical protein VTN00DRAFT_5528 [Thermoascus crustaceus]|uniref:uncharacterized protein n=1 Tax=Thermoascus crustaceus TaxID=5088 RepID=UPI003741ECF3